MSRVETLAPGAAPAALLEAVRALCLDAFGADFTPEDWDHALGGHHVVVREPELVAHVAVVPRTIHAGDRPLRAGYLEAVAVRPGRQRQGLGTLALARAGDLVRRHHEVGVLSTASPSFFARLGWQRWEGPTYVLDRGRWVRTADEDDGVMVLLAGPTAGLDRRQPIACEARPGDDW